MKKKEVESKEHVIFMTTQKLFDIYNEIHNKYDEAGVDDINVSNDFENDVVVITQDCSDLNNVKVQITIKMETFQDFKFEV
jgi:sorbitol-specific phosphotransferase system component IIBC